VKVLAWLVAWPLGLLLAVLAWHVPVGAALADAHWRWCWFAIALALVAVAVLGLRRLAALEFKGPIGAALTPLLFGAWVLVFWQFLTQAFDVPRVLLPAPALIGRALLDDSGTLAADFVQTVLHSMLIGLALGSALGFVVGVLIDRSPFLQRGLLPIAALASTVPLVGVAPIMVMWFGFDWHSKAAVVVVMTFFPMLVNTLAGLAEAGHMERDLMRSYGAGYWRTLASLRIPAALPFIFNALKINSTLALIGAIVAEFFGSPVLGLGFRISTEAARLNMGLVWAAIVVAAVAGSLLYALLGWIERRSTFWHPSMRMG
jgi:NitT/TauT family transport system permease protein